MTPASRDLYAFAHATIRGICDNQDEVSIEVIESSPKTITVTVSCDPNYLKFIYSKSKCLKVLAIAIARRHKVMVNLMIEEGAAHA